ncbi:MAG: PHP domain-containing protein [Desulfococcaceae bacterium]|jgi:predicted metal-dependent phosphoesterase TrpH|nr:PHP domain-containing protein [Desulfococcaceae bacterium]
MNPDKKAGIRTRCKIDLHIHSTASDGTLTPSEILHGAAEIGLEIISLTDHDTVSGVREILRAEIPLSLRFISGTEISAASPAKFPCAGSFHILGYNIDPENTALNRKLEILRQARHRRNPLILEKLRHLGMDIREDEVRAHAGDSPPGRPHIAGLMLKKGYVNSVEEAFDKYIGNGKAAYADKYRISYTDAIDMIRNAGGVPVMAHPGLLKPVKDFPLEDMVKELKEKGMGGIEVWYPEHSPEQTAYFARLADRWEMIKTGGTDFHGAVKPGIQMGIAGGRFFVPDSVRRDLEKSGFL